MSHQDGSSAPSLPSPQPDARFRLHHASTPQHSPLMPPMRIINTNLRHDSLQGTIGGSHSQPHPIQMPPPTLDMRASRPLGVRSILNPQTFDAPPIHGRRRSASQMETPSPIGSLSPVQSPSPAESGGSSLSLPPISRPSSRGVSEESSTSTNQSRRILSPRSPSLHRSQSLFLKGPETGSIDARTTPFLSSGAGAPPVQRLLATGPGPSPAPRIHTPPAGYANGSRPDYFPRHQPTPPPPSASHQHRRSIGSMRSEFESHSAQASPRFSSRGSSQLADVPPSRYGTPVAMPGPSMMEEHNPFGIPVLSAAQSNYQLLTLETQQGQIRIPVDVQAASKMADEKRKRNAGASARFRARRKEKEKEASETIAKLEQEIKEKEEDVEFYRGERDALTSVLYNTPGMQTQFPRPASPRARRRQANSSPSLSAASSLSSRHGDRRSEQPSEHDRNVRRRTSAYVPPTSGTEPIAAMSSPMTSSGGFQGLPPLHSPQSRDMGSSHREVSPRTVVPHERYMAHSERTWSHDSGRHDRPHH